MKHARIQTDARWLTVRDAAAALSMRPEALRRALERRARRAPDGGTEADIDGVRGRKFARHWRVRLAGPWAPPAEPRPSSAT